MSDKEDIVNKWICNKEHILSVFMEGNIRKCDCEGCKTFLNMLDAYILDFSKRVFKCHPRDIEDKQLVPYITILIMKLKEFFSEIK